MGKFDSLFGTVLVIRNSIFDIRYSRKKGITNHERRILNHE